MSVDKNLVSMDYGTEGGEAVAAIEKRKTAPEPHRNEK